MELKKLVAASTNPDKIGEMRAIFPDTEIVSMADAGYTDEIEENGTSFDENAYIKARRVSSALGVPAIADDSGICVDALGGAPGIFSARYSGKGMAENRRLLLRNMSGEENRRAHFHCTVCLCYPDGECVYGRGDAYGQILGEERGSGGFGYDPLFLSDDLGVSFGEAGPEAKNAVSHRFRALQDLKRKLDE